MSSWAILGLWTIPALLSALETVVFARMTGHPISPVRAFIAEAPQWYGWALLTPVVAGLGERFPLRRPLRARVIVVHALASLSASLLVACADAVVNAAVRPSPGGVPTGIWNWFVSGLPVTTLVYFAIIGIAYALRSAARLREREQRAAHLEAELRQAQLGALRMQLQPHFLFNALNAVMALVRDQDTTRAVRALSLLSDVLRTTVNAGDALESTLGDEVEFVTRYLEIERIRFGERLTVAVRVPGDLKDALVPVFVLQPFVENALKHGILRGREGNEVVVSAAAHGGTLALVVRDDGVGLPPDGAAEGARSGGGGGVGIANARARLERMYGAAARVSVHDAPDGPGVVAEITLPLRRAASTGVEPQPLAAEVPA